MEKKANEFALNDTNETFELKGSGVKNAAESQNNGLFNGITFDNGLNVGEDPNQIVLNIVDSKDGKIKLTKSVRKFEFTGGFFRDLYKQANDYLIDHSSIKVRDKASTLRLLATMLDAGMPLIKSLNTLASQDDDSPRLQRVLLSLAKEIEGGKSLSEAMDDYPEIFSEAETGVIKAGEASGQLNKTLKTLAVQLEKTASITGKVKGALVYPVVVMCLLVAVIFLMMIMVIPQITKLFSQSGTSLPLATRVLIAVSDYSVNYWPLMIGLAVAAFFGLSWGVKTRYGKYLWDTAKINMPIFGEIIKKTLLAKFARGFGNLLGAGVPIIKAIEIVAYSVGNEVYKRRLLLTSEDMKKGIPMAENLTESKLFPKMLVNMIEVGEQTAQLEAVTAKVASFYEEEVDTAVKSLTKIMEPLILVVIGVTVGGLVAAIMMPIIELTNVAGNMG